MNKPSSFQLPAEPPARRDEGVPADTVSQGRSGEGADSVLPHLWEQEERRKPLDDR